MFKSFSSLLTINKNKNIQFVRSNFGFLNNGFQQKSQMQLKFASTSSTTTTKQSSNESSDPRSG